MKTLRILTYLWFIVGLSFHLVFADTDADTEAAIDEVLFQEGEPAVIEIHVKFNDGCERELIPLTTALKDMSIIQIFTGPPAEEDCKEEGITYKITQEINPSEDEDYTVIVLLYSGTNADKEDLQLLDSEILVIKPDEEEYSREECLDNCNEQFDDCEDDCGEDLEDCIEDLEDCIEYCEGENDEEECLDNCDEQFDDCEDDCEDDLEDCKEDCEDEDDESGDIEIHINEIRISQPGTDNDEYFELAGPEDSSLDGLTYLVIGHDTEGSGGIEAVVDLNGETIPNNGFFVAAESTFTLGTADLTTTLNFNNSNNVTHLLVRDFTGSNQDDLDTDDDGVLDVTPWEEIIDSVALIESEETGDQVYSSITVGPDGSSVPGHVFLCPGGWEIGQDDPDGGDDTPGTANVCGVSPIEAKVDIKPETLNLKSNGRWVTAYIELSEGYVVEDIDIGSIRLEETIDVELSETLNDVLMVKFSRQALIVIIEEMEVELPASIELKVTGKLNDETHFEATDSIRVIDPGKDKNKRNEGDNDNGEDNKNKDHDEDDKGKGNNKDKDDKGKGNK